MRIVIVSQIFETLEDNGSDRLIYFSKSLVDRGYEVTIITSNFDYKLGRKRFDNEKKFCRNVSGVKVVYLPVYSNVRGSYFRRFLFFISFMRLSLFELVRRSEGADIIWAISTPLTVPFVAAFVSWWKRVPLISEITDVWPDAAEHSGVVKNKILIQIARRIELYCYKSSAKIICLTEGICENIMGKGVDRSKICLVTNGVDLDLFNTTEFSCNNFLNFQPKIQNKFVAMYLGAHGRYNALHTIIDTAIILRENAQIVFWLVGDGEEKKKLMERASNEGLDNVLFSDPVMRRDCPAMLSYADCFLLPNLSGDFFECNLPNKLFDYLACGRPIVVAGEVESSRLVKKIDAGLVVAAEQPVQLADAIKKLTRVSVEEREAMGERAAQYVRKYYNRESQVDIIDGILNTVFQDRTN